MKKLLLALALLGLCLGIIFGWYFISVRSYEAKANQYEQWVREQKPVRIEFIVAAPQKETPADQMLYLSGNSTTLGNWDAAGVPLARG